jgi:hypothetical protein
MKTTKSNTAGFPALSPHKVQNVSALNVAITKQLD